MRILSFTRILSLSLLLASSTGASAATIFSQDFDPTLMVGQADSDFGSSTQRATSFSFSGGDQILGSVSWLGVNPILPSSDDFTIRIFSDNGSGLPEATASILDFNVANAVNRVDTGVDTIDIFHRDIYSYQADLSAGINLTSGVNYWLSIINNIGTSGADDWRWGASGSSPQSSVNRALDSDIWNPNLAVLQFDLSTAPAAVPIPAALWLMLSGVAGLAAFKRKKQA